MVSGRKIDKFQQTNLTPSTALKINTPIILECPVNIECRVRKTIDLGSHTLFLAEVVAVQVTESLLDSKGKLHLEKGGLLAYALGQYFVLGRTIGRFGYSVRKKRSRKKT